MTTKATIKQSDLRRMAAVANDQNVTVEMEINGHWIKVMPNIPVIHQTPIIDSSIEPEMVSLQAWREKHGNKNGRDTHR